MKFLLLLISMISFQLIMAQKTMTPELLWKLNRLSGGEVSPDGKLVLFSIRSFNMEANKGNTELHVLDLKSGKSTQITQTESSEMEAQWGKDNVIWYLSSEKDGMQIWTINHDGTGKSQKSNFKNIELEGFKLSPDESFVVTIEAVKFVDQANEKYADLKLANARIENDLMYRHWDHFDDGLKRHLFVHYIGKNKTVDARGVDILQGEAFHGILPPHGGTDNFTISNDGKKIVYASKKMNGKQFATSTNSALYEYDLSTRSSKNLTEENLGYDNNPQYAKNGLLAWTAMARDGFESDKNDLKYIDQNGKTINLTGEMDITVSSFKWSIDAKKLFFIVPTKGTEQIFEVDLASKKIRQITSGMHDYVSLSVNENKIIAGRQSFVLPSDLFEVNMKNGAAKQLTEVNKENLKDIALPTVEETWVTTTDNKKMLVWMVYPPNKVADKKYPALLYCQGGPQSMVSQFYSYRWNLALMASQGYVVIAPNRRGLPGFGQEWNDAISKDWGGQAIQDYLSATDAAILNPNVDKERMGAVGASYGGYSVFMLAGVHNNRFKTFISHCGLFNLESWYGTTEELFFANWDHGGPYWLEENKENFVKNSPHRYVANWNTPIMVIQGGMDFRVPESEGMQAFQVAQLKGIKSRYLYFPKESHWVTSPQNGLLWQREFFEWLAEDLRP
ncbi:MAG: S9 family peptidase [Bacteroidia bacterium]|nr:MAG: S9 family peptidase [Bacteroidia bacterium]